MALGLPNNEGEESLSAIAASGIEYMRFRPHSQCEERRASGDEILKRYYISMGYVPIALRQVIRRHGLQEMRRLWYSLRMFARYVSRR